MKRILLLGILLAAVVATISAQTHERCSAQKLHNAALLNNPDIQKKNDDLEAKTNQYINSQAANKSAIVYTIPIVVHVIHNGEPVGTAPNVSDALVFTQIARLNEDFRKTNADTLPPSHPFYSDQADVEIEFCLAKRDEAGNATTGINRYNFGQAVFDENEINNIIKPSTIWNRNDYINLWVVDIGDTAAPGLDGFATFPSEGTDSTDGVVVADFAFGDIFGKSIVATHEMGHFFNLNHIWGDNQPNCGDDMVADTPPAFEANSGCPTFPRSPNDSCGTDSNGQMYMNYMDYSDAFCTVMFTNGQKDRMRAALLSSRVSLTTSMGCVPPAGGCPVPSNLSASTTGTSATLTWDAVAGATSYQLTGGVVGGPAVAPITISGTSFTANNLSNPACYYWQVKATCGANGMSAYSAIDTFCLSCNTPMNVAAFPFGTNSVDLEWDAVPGAIGYIIEGGPTSNPTAASITVFGGSTDFFTVNNLATGNYQWRIRSGCSVSPLVLSPFSAYDFFSITGSSAKGEQLFNSASMKVKVYPNPANDVINLHITSATSNDLVVEIIDMTGRTISLADFNMDSGNRFAMNTSDLSNGVYQLLITNGSSIQSERIVIGR